MTEAEIKIPDEFFKIMTDLYADIITTFPEYKDVLEDTYKDLQSGDKDLESIKMLHVYCKTKYPERFFDLLYQNEDMFGNSDIDTFFLPGIDFKDIWNDDITDNTKTIIWKYLQLVCFSVVNSEKSDEMFGDTAKLFEAIDENELKKKLTETMGQMAGVFEENDISGENMQEKSPEDIPDPEDLHNHISGLLDGKLGRLATEITEETMKDFQDISGVSSMNDIFQVLFKNPGKLMNMVKNIGGNLDAKIKSGEIKESELIQEAEELMKKMEDMPGMKNMKNMMSQMGLPTGGGKMDVGAMKGQMKRNISKAKIKERLRKKLEHKNINVKTPPIPSVSNDKQIEILEKQLAEAKSLNAGNESNSKKRRNRRKKNKGDN
tara:strand:- start:5879 stop:7009 length:1131 start_codon:yes stop_codon:yes gene_type:complete